MAATSLERAYAHCEAIARRHYENFPVASLAVPRHLRPHVCAIYAFARGADDFADEPEFAGRRLESLDAWERALDRSLEGTADDPVFIALADTVNRCELPVGLLRDLLDAFRQDCTVSRYGSWADLVDYARRSANPVGRMVLWLFGHRDAERAARSDAICTALQFTNFWQDVAVDLAKDRIYLPSDARQRHGVSEGDLKEGRLHDGFRALLAEMCAATRELYGQGRPLLAMVRGRLALELRLVWMGGRRVLDRIEDEGYDVFGHRPTLGAADRAGVLARALIGGIALPR